jgi:hypothetical protein
MTTFGGIVVTDEEWREYAVRVAAAGGGRIRVRFSGDRSDTEIFVDQNQSSSGNRPINLVCQRRGEPVVPVYSYSEAMSDPNTEAASASATFLQRMVASGMPPALALELTQRLYRRRPHDEPIPDRIVDSLLAQWRRGGF